MSSFALVCLATTACLSVVGARAELSKPAYPPLVGPFKGPKRHLRVHEPKRGNDEERGIAETVASTISAHTSEEIDALLNGPLYGEELASIDHLMKPLEVKPSTGVELKLREGIGMDEIRSILGHFKKEINSWNKIHVYSPITLLQVLKANYGNKGVDKIIETVIKDEDAVSKVVTDVTELQPVEPSVEVVENLRKGMGNRAKIMLRYWMHSIDTNSETTLVEFLETKLGEDRADKLIEIALEDEATVSMAVTKPSKLQPRAKRVKTSQKANSSRRAKLKISDEIGKDFESISRNWNDYNKNKDATGQLTLLQFLEAHYDEQGMTKILSVWKRNKDTKLLAYLLGYLHQGITPEQLFFKIQETRGNRNFFADNPKLSIWIDYVRFFNQNVPEKAKNLLDWLGYTEKEAANMLFDAVKFPRNSPTLRIVLRNLNKRWIQQEKEPAKFFDDLGLSKELGHDKGFDSQRFREWWDYVTALNKKRGVKVSQISLLVSRYRPDILMEMLEKAGDSWMVMRVADEFIKHLELFPDIILKHRVKEWRALYPKKGRIVKKRKFAS